MDMGPKFRARLRRDAENDALLAQEAANEAARERGEVGDDDAEQALIDSVYGTRFEDPYGVELSDEDVAEILGEREYDREKGN